MGWKFLNIPFADVIVFRQTDGRFWPASLENVTCTGNESTLFNCSHAVVEHLNYFGYSGDLSVVCITGKNGST